MARNRWRRFFIVACLICVAALCLALLFRAARPRWTTFVSSSIHSVPPYRLVIRVPPGWECLEEGETPDNLMIKMHPKPPVGVARWWQRYVLRKDVSQTMEAQGTIQLLWSQVKASNGDADYFRFLASGMLESSPSISRIYEHPLGPALERTYGQGSAVHDYQTRIVVRRHPVGQRLEVIVGRSGTNANANRTASEWEQIVRSLRLQGN